MNLEFGLISNGLSVKKGHLKSLRQYRPYSFGVSVDGLRDTHNKIRRNSKSWINAINLIKKLKVDKFEVAVVTTVASINYLELNQLADLLVSLSVDTWQLQVAIPFGRAGKNYELIVNQDILHSQLKNLKKMS